MQNFLLLVLLISERDPQFSCPSNHPAVPVFGLMLHPFLKARQLFTPLCYYAHFQNNSSVITPITDYLCSREVPI